MLVKFIDFIMDYAQNSYYFGDTNFLNTLLPSS